MRRVLLNAAAAVMLITTNVSALAADKQPLPHTYGPQPSWADFRDIAETEVAARLLDPESARFEWLSGIYKGEGKPFLSPRVSGYWACGAVNAKNRMGGYTGFETFLIAIDYDRVLSYNKDSRPGGIFDDACAKAIREGRLPPLPPEALRPATARGSGSPSRTAAEATDPDAAPLANSAGLAIRAMPEGAYVASVKPGSPADRAKLKPGMVITSVNAIPLAGMGEAMAKVVDAAGTSTTLTLVGGTTLRLGAGK